MLGLDGGAHLCLRVRLPEYGFDRFHDDGAAGYRACEGGTLQQIVSESIVLDRCTSHMFWKKIVVGVASKGEVALRAWLTAHTVASDVVKPGLSLGSAGQEREGALKEQLEFLFLFVHFICYNPDRLNTKNNNPLKWNIYEVPPQSFFFSLKSASCRGC
jgi:hypothetical protein